MTKSGRWKRRGGASLALLAILLTASGGVPAAEPDTPATTESVERLTREVAGIRGSLERIASLLDELASGQEIDLLLRRIELKERRLEAPSRELSRIRQDLDGAKAERQQLGAYLESLAEEVTRGQLSGEDVAALQAEREQIEGLVEAQLATIDSLEGRIPPLEDEIADVRDEIEVLEEMLDERLRQP